MKEQIMLSIYNLKNLLFAFVIINCTAFGQKNKEVHNSALNTSFTKQNIDTSNLKLDTLYYSSSSIKSIGKFLPLDYNMEVSVGWWKSFYRNFDLKDSTFYNYQGDPLYNKRFYHSKILKEILISDTSAIPKKDKRGISVSMKILTFYKIKYRKSGIIKFEGKYLDNKKHGEWIYYNKKGMIRRRKKHN